MQLRPYQSRLVAEAEASYQYLVRAAVIVLSTAGGKTVIFSQIAKNATARGLRVWVIAHRKELINQASKTMGIFGVEHGVIRAGVTPEPGKLAQVASIQTVVRRLDTIEPPDLLIIDESHHSLAGSYTKVFDAFPNASIIGVTATPCRLNGSGLGSVFETMLHGPSNVWLTDEGFLAPARYFAPPPKADLSNLHQRAGDYITSEMSEAMDVGAVTGDAVEHYERICPGVPMIVFCTSIEHAAHVAEDYRKAGYRAASVDGKLSEADRDDRLAGLASGKYQIITSCELIGEGLDVPAVVAVQLLRPTASLVYHLQFIGRALRPIYADGADLSTKEGRVRGIAEGVKPAAFVLDHVGNVAKHGFASTERNWTLEGKKRQSEKPPALRTCEACYSVHRTAKVCPYCFFEYQVKSRTLTAKKMVDGQLVEVEQTKEERIEEVRNARTHGELMAIAKARGYKKPHWWALKTLKGRSYVNLLPKIQ